MYDANLNRCEYRRKDRGYHCPSHYHKRLHIANDIYEYCDHHADVVAAIIGKKVKELLDKPKEE